MGDIRLMLKMLNFVSAAFYESQCGSALLLDTKML